jgi:hypothetical protein
MDDGEDESENELVRVAAVDALHGRISIAMRTESRVGDIDADQKWRKVIFSTP